MNKLVSGLLNCAECAGEKGRGVIRLRAAEKQARLADQAGLSALLPKRLGGRIITSTSRDFARVDSCEISGGHRQREVGEGR